GSRPGGTATGRDRLWRARAHGRRRVTRGQGPRRPGRHRSAPHPYHPGPGGMSMAHHPTRRGGRDRDPAPAAVDLPPRGTLKDVAAAAGVHPATASRSLAPTRAFRVRAETRQRVLAAAAQLGYRPHRLAGSLRRQRTSTVGVLVADYETAIHAELLRGISTRLERDGYVPISLETQDRHDRLLTSIRILVEHRVDGVITAATRKQELEIGRAHA